MTAFDTWESYFYPETYNRATGEGTLRNLFGERDAGVLHEKEYARTRRRQQEIRDRRVDIPRTFDAAHLKALHRHVFQDVFEWAGAYRTVEIYKGSPRGFASAKTGEIERYLSDVHTMVTGADWARMDHAAFSAASAHVFAWTNQAHPFREGNGRSSKLLMEHVSELSPFRFEWERVDVDRWNEASMLSGPDMFAYEPHPEELYQVFQTVAVGREQQAPGQLSDELEQLRSLTRTSYPRSAAEAAKDPQCGGSGSGTASRDQYGAHRGLGDGMGR
ncbi:Fic/DOC family protein [Sinomonas sp. P47F7]|uniref:Fic/DOC family protein n=1 Tax=Sinomonas sp. P47F7 TaxID=3410987 RepID=UPI003BF604CC